jgi:serine protease 12 (motopsin)
MFVLDTESLDVKFRLVGKDQPKYSGQLNVYYGTWGNICANDLKLEDAHVICRMLNYTEALTISHWGKTTGNASFLLLHNCTGRENNTKYCPGLKLKQVNACGNNNFAGIVCNPKTGGTFCYLFSRTNTQD